MRAALALALAATLLACTRRSQPAPDAAASAAGAAPAAVPAAAATDAYVASVTALRRAPVEATRVPGPSGKDISNFLTLLHRGEGIAVLEAKDDWAKVRSSGDVEGYLKRSAIVEGAGVALATTLAETDLFERPELLAATRKLAPGVVVFVLKTKAPFSEVNVAGTQTAWVLSDRLATGDKDVELAKLVEKARWLVRTNKRDDAVKALDLAREHFPDHPLVNVLADELGTPAAAPIDGPALPLGGDAGQAGAVPAAAPR